MENVIMSNFSWHKGDPNDIETFHFLIDILIKKILKISIFSD